MSFVFDIVDATQQFREMQRSIYDVLVCTGDIH